MICVIKFIPMFVQPVLAHCQNADAYGLLGKSAVSFTRGAIPIEQKSFMYTFTAKLILRTFLLNIRHDPLRNGRWVFRTATQQPL